MKTNTRISTFTACTALFAAGTAFAWDGAPITYINAQLELREGTLLELNQSIARIRDTDSRERQIPFDQLAAIIFEDADTATETSTGPRATTPVAQGMIITTDRQRLRGKPIEGDPGAESLLWDGPPFGPRVFPLESLLTFRPGSGSEVPVPNRVDTDIIIFKNADRAPTFVESIIATRPEPVAEPDPADNAAPRDPAAWRRTRRVDRNAASQRRTVALISGVVRAEVQNRPTDIPLERIQAITFANPPERPKPLPRAWLSDSTVIATSTISLDVPRTLGNAAPRRLGDSAIQLETPAERPTLVLTIPQSGPGSQRLASAIQPTPDAAGRVPLRSVEAIAIDVSRLVPLSACQIRSEPIANTTRRWTPPAQVAQADAGSPAPLDALDITLPGPMQIVVDLPATATHVGGIVTLPLSARPLASCRARVAIIDPSSTVHEILSVNLSAQNPSHPISAAMPRDASGPFQLRISLEPTDDGPIQDSIVLRRFLVLVEP